MRAVIQFLKTDWRLTKSHAAEFAKRVDNYHYFRRRGFTVRQAWLYSMNVL